MLRQNEEFLHIIKLASGVLLTTKASVKENNMYNIDTYSSK